jgi:hypothetical protein
MELLKKRLANLLCIKSIVTLLMVSVFSWITIQGRVSADQFMTIFAVVISFYFGTQAQKTNPPSDT